MLLRMQRRLLFVDDEPLIREMYASLAVLLGKGHEIHTARCGQDALRLLTEKPFDVIVSDLAMPEMDGLEFLHEVVRGYPESARIVVSGFADRLKITECLTVGHRFFHKPINIATLANLLRRICQYSHLVSNERVRRMVCGTAALPSPPGTYLRLTEALASPFSDIDQIASIVERDAGISTKLLHIVNSAEFAPSRPIVTPAEAVQVAGVEVIRALVLAVEAFGFYRNNQFIQNAFADLWSHSFSTAIAARKIALLESLPVETAEQSFLAGLLHDIGKLVLAANAEPEYKVALDLANKAAVPLDHAEMGIFATTHAHVGAYLLALWGLPDPVITAIELHHSLDLDRIKGFDCAVAVHVAQNLQTNGTRKKFLNTALLEQLGLVDRIPLWEEALRQGTRVE